MQAGSVQSSAIRSTQTSVLESVHRSGESGRLGMPSSAIRRVPESVLGSVLGSVLRSVQ
jgi:hypothetical protein